MTDTEATYVAVRVVPGRRSRPTLAASVAPPTDDAVFATESELVDFAVSHLPGFLQQESSAFRLGTELGMGRRVADVVAMLTCASDSGLPSFSFNITESLVLSTLRQH